MCSQILKDIDTFDILGAWPDEPDRIGYCFRVFCILASAVAISLQTSFLVQLRLVLMRDSRQIP